MRGEKSHLGIAPSLNLFGIWTGDSIGLSMWQLQLLPSLTFPEGSLRYVIFLSDILKIFYDSFLEHQLFNSFSHGVISSSLAVGLCGDSQNLCEQKKSNILWYYIHCSPYKCDLPESNSLLACFGDC